MISEDTVVSSSHFFGLNADDADALLGAIPIVNVESYFSLRFALLRKNGVLKVRHDSAVVQNQRAELNVQLLLGCFGFFSVQEVYVLVQLKYGMCSNFQRTRWS